MTYPWALYDYAWFHSPVVYSDVGVNWCWIIRSAESCLDMSGLFVF